MLVQDPLTGKKYKTMKELANAYNLTAQCLYSRLYVLGLSLDKALVYEKPKVKDPITGKEYKTVIELCRAHKISVDTFYKRLHKGMSMIDALNTPLSKPVKRYKYAS